jgi:hypothetical protein
MVGDRTTIRQRALLLSLALSLCSCGLLIDLDELQKAGCVSKCVAGSGGSPGDARAPTAGEMTGAMTTGGTTTSGDASGTGGAIGIVGTGEGTSPDNGTAATSGTAQGGASPNVAGASGGGAVPAGTGGLGGGAANVPVCPGGPEPPLTWQEHWLDHSELLDRVHYDDCIALYFDQEVDPEAKDWLVSFLDRSWSYSLAAYGAMGPERIYVVVHQGSHYGGHTATFIEASHDRHATIDMGAIAWIDGSYELPATLLGSLVDTEGARTKFGAPGRARYGLQGFVSIYKYDLYSGLGLDEAAAVAKLVYDAIASGQPSSDSHWFRDWFYPIWRDHGHAQVFAQYLALLQAYYPAGADMWMPTMTYGEYFHFMSGAAGTDLTPLAKEHFELPPGFEAELARAKQAYPDIKY